MFYILLVGVMIFYFMQAVKLKQKEISSISHQKMDDLLEEHFYKEISLTKENLLYTSFLDLLQQKTTLENIKTDFTSVLDKNNELFTKKIDSTFSTLGYEVAAKIVIKQVVIHDSKEELLDKPFVLLETKRKLNAPQRINTSEWEN